MTTEHSAHADVTPDLQKPSDKILEKVKETILARTGSRILDLKVEARGNMIVLLGHAPYQYWFQLATHAAIDGAGMDHKIINEIEVPK